MLSVEPTKLSNEITESETHLDRYLHAVKQVRAYFPNASYSTGGGESPGIQYDNYIFDMVATTLPKLCYDNPRFTVRGLGTAAASFADADPMAPTPGDAAEALEAAVNQWAGIVNLRKTLQLMAVDYMLGWAVGMVRLEPMYESASGGSGGEWEQRIPRLEVLAPDEFRIDPYASSYEKAKWKGRLCAREREDLIAEAEANPDAGWKVDAIKQFGTDGETAKMGRESGFEKSSNRDEVTYYELWIPGHRLPNAPGPDEGYHGTLVTITGEGQVLREPRPYYGPRWGPYVFWGCYPVPRRIYPLSPAVAHKPLVDDLNRAIKIVRDANAGYKRVLIYDAANPDIAAKMQSAATDFMLPVRNFGKDQVVALELGGATEHQLRDVLDQRGLLDRATGMQEAARGGLTATPNTATEVGVADSAHQMRSSFITQSFADGVIQIGKTAGWYMHHDDRVVFGLDAENVGSTDGMDDGVFYGGLHEGQQSRDFDDMLWDLEPLSMERTAQGVQQGRIRAMTDTIVTLAPMIPANPHIDWSRLLEMFGDAHQIRRLDEIILPMPAPGAPVAPGVPGIATAAIDPAAQAVPAEEPTIGELIDQGMDPAALLGNQTGPETGAAMGVSGQP